MLRLIGLELRRFYARDMVRLVGIVFALGSLAVGVGAFVTSADIPAEREKELASEVREALDDDLQECEDGRVIEGFHLEGRPRWECLEQIYSGVYPDTSFRLTALLSTVLPTTLPIAIFAWLVGATLIGAEWGAGTIGVQLTWEPRRSRVILAKILALFIGVFAGIVLLNLFLAGSLLPAAVFRGTWRGITGVWLGSMATVLLKSGSIVFILGAIGFSVGSLIRNTSAAVGVGFGYLFVIEGLLSTFTEELREWLLTPNVLWFFEGQAVNIDGVTKSPGEAGLLLGIYAAVALSLAIVMFVRRDVA